MEDIENGLVRETFVAPQPLSASDGWLLRRFVDGETSLREGILGAYPQLAAGAVRIEPPPPIRPSEKPTMIPERIVRRSTNVTVRLPAG